jgi:hypothetical protein
LIDDKQRAIDIYTPKMSEQFAHVGELDELEVSVLRLRRDIEAQQNTPEAIARRAEAEERMRAAGRKPGWSLELNPSKKMVAESDFDTAEKYVAAVVRTHARAAAGYVCSAVAVKEPRDRTGLIDNMHGIPTSLLDDLGAVAAAIPDTSRLGPEDSFDNRPTQSYMHQNVVQPRHDLGR